MELPAGYRNITLNDKGKTFGHDLERVIIFDDTVSVGSWYINDGPVLEMDVVEWMLFSDNRNFISRRSGVPNSWMIDPSYLVLHTALLK